MEEELMNMSDEDFLNGNQSQMMQPPQVELKPLPNKKVLGKGKPKRVSNSDLGAQSGGMKASGKPFSLTMMSFNEVGGIYSDEMAEFLTTLGVTPAYVEENLEGLNPKVKHKISNKVMQMKHDKAWVNEALPIQEENVKRVEKARKEQASKQQAAMDEYINMQAPQSVEGFI